MGIIAWIVLGLGAGLLANMLIPGRRSQGLILTCVIGIAGALETGIQAVWLSPYRADLPARRPVRLGSGCRFPGMLLSPVTFRITGQPSDPKTPPPVHARYAGYTAVRLVAHPYRRQCARFSRRGLITHGVPARHRGAQEPGSETG